MFACADVGDGEDRRIDVGTCREERIGRSERDFAYRVANRRQPEAKDGQVVLHGMYSKVNLGS